VLVTELEGARHRRREYPPHREQGWRLVGCGRYHAFQLAQLNRLHTNAATPPTGVTILGGDFNLASDGALYPHIVGHGTWHDPSRTRTRALPRAVPGAGVGSAPD
jgi:hypothetical protein